jgi:hypothetical protein
MKKICFLLFVASFFMINQTCGQADPVAPPPTTVKKGWPSPQRATFISECVKVAKNSMSEDSARHYCYCMEEKMEIKYPDYQDADKITKEELQSAEWKKLINNCLTESHWDTKNRETFLTDCVNSAKTNLGDSKAKSYCECMLYKVEQHYPNPQDAGKLTAEKLASPEWKEIVKGCLDF